MVISRINAQVDKSLDMLEKDNTSFAKLAGSANEDHFDNDLSMISPLKKLYNTITITRDQFYIPVQNVNLIRFLKF